MHGLAAGLYAFATHPEFWQHLRVRPGPARVPFDETVRWQSPAQILFRTTVTAVTIADVAILAEAEILMLLASARRDPVSWADPDRFDLARDSSCHVEFGMGLHQCVGRHVAWLKSESFLAALARCVERAELTAPPRHHLNNTLRSWAALPARVELSRV